LDLGDGFQARSRTLLDKRRLWWNLVKHLSRFEAAERQARLDEVQAQLGPSDDWSTQVLSGPLRRRFLMLNAEEVRSLVAAGMGVGAHTLTHPLLSQLPPEAAWAEIAESRARLQQVIGQPVWSGKWRSAPDSVAPS
jgi:peptidoglycan/xylan/chitin deacetylase (PgdA/CDA1 family)